MALEDYVNKIAPEGDLPKRLALYFPGAVVIAAIMLPNRTDQLNTFLLNWFLKPFGLLYILVTAICGYLVGRLWQSPTLRGKSYALGLTIAFVLLSAIGYWYFEKIKFF